MTVERSFLDDDLLFSLDAVVRVPGRDMMFNPELKYRVRDGIKWIMGLYWFNGDSHGMFGQFDSRDFVYTGLDCSF